MPANVSRLTKFGALAWCILLPACRSEVSGWVLSERAPTAPAGPDANPGDGGCPSCAASVAWINASRTPRFGSPESQPFDDACPGDQAIIGFRGSVQDVGVFLVSSIQTFCGRPVIASATATEVSVLPGAALPERGLPSGASWSQMCPRDQMVVGFWGRSGRSLDQIGFDCAGVKVARDASNAFALAVDTTISELSPPNGGDGGEPFRASCMPGQIARVANLNASAWIDTFGLTCATPAASMTSGP